MEIFAWAVAALAAGLSIGFYREGALAREQVNYLRRQLAHLSGAPMPTEPKTTALVSLPGKR